MATKLPKLDCSRGAPMGRREKHLPDGMSEQRVKLKLQIVPLDSGGL